MGIFDKCGEYGEARSAQAAGVYPYYVRIEEAEPTRVRVEGRWKLMMGSNNYLGLTHHPLVLRAATKALERYGTAATGSRLLNGNLEVHEALEAELADFLGKEAAVVFATGFMANLGALSALGGRGDHLFLDRMNHASIIDGARLSFAGVERYPHGDLGALGERLEAAPSDAGKLVVTDGVFSMGGDVVALPALVEVARAHGAAVMVDDAHGLGVLGESGAGTAEHFGMVDDVDVIMSTFSKSLGSVGGVVAGSTDLVHFLRHRARSLLFSASLPPASAASALAALKVLRSEPERRRALRSNGEWLRSELRAQGFSVEEGCSAIVPLRVGGYDRVLRFWRELYERDVYVNAVVPPGVPDDASRIRLSVTALHTRSELERAVEAIGEVESCLPVSAGA